METSPTSESGLPLAELATCLGDVSRAVAASQSDTDVVRRAFAVVQRHINTDGLAAVVDTESPWTVIAHAGDITLRHDEEQAPADHVRIDVRGSVLDALVVHGAIGTNARAVLVGVGAIIDAHLARIRIERDLHERVKELSALREVQVAIESEADDVQLAQRVVDAAVAGMQFPELARAEMHLDGVTTVGGAAGELVMRLGSDIVAAGRVRGDLLLGYVEQRSFLEPEERNLVTAIARSVGMHVELVEARHEAEAQAARAGDALVQERTVANELRRIDDMKTTFLSAVSHELRTPLTSVLGFAETAHQLVDSELARDLIGRIEQNARRLERLVDDLLDVDRMTRGEVLPDRTPTDLAALIARVADADMLDVPLEIDLAPVTLSVDRRMIERVVDNLVRNIRRHTPEGTRAWIRLVEVADGANIIVEDEGPGIDPELRERVFEPFAQGNSATSAHSPGTGIGLSLVQRFVEVHGGTVTVGERPGGGARFTVWLPRVPVG